MCTSCSFTKCLAMVTPTTSHLHSTSQSSLVTQPFTKRYEHHIWTFTLFSPLFTFLVKISTTSAASLMIKLTQRNMLHMTKYPKHTAFSHVFWFLSLFTFPMNIFTQFTCSCLTIYLLVFFFEKLYISYCNTILFIPSSTCCISHTFTINLTQPSKGE